MEKLVSAFQFAVYDANLNRTSIRAHGIERSPYNHLVYFYSWLPDFCLPSSSAQKRTLYIHHRSSFDSALVSGSTADEIGVYVARAFCVFVQGAWLGWRVFDENVLKSENQHQEARHEIILEKHLPQLPLHQFLDQLGINENTIRQFVRDDMVKFAFDMYRRRGAMHSWTQDEFLDSGYLRYGCVPSLVHTVIEDLFCERVFGGVSTVNRFALAPEVNLSGIDEDADARISSHLQDIVAFGVKQGFCEAEAPSTPIDACSEVHITMDQRTEIHGDVTGSAIGPSAQVQTGDIGIAKVALVEADLDDRTREVLVQATNCLESLSLPAEDKADAEDDLAKLADELQKEAPRPGRMNRLWNHIQEVAPTVAALLKSIEVVAKALT